MTPVLAAIIAAIPPNAIAYILSAGIERLKETGQVHQLHNNAELQRQISFNVDAIRAAAATKAEEADAALAAKAAADAERAAAEAEAAAQAPPAKPGKKAKAPANGS